MKSFIRERKFGERYFGVLVTLVAISLTACGGSNDGTLPSAATLASSCNSMNAKMVDASELGLPTSGAIVTSATLVEPSATGNVNVQYCKVLGRITPDAAAKGTGTPDIQFQLNLPTTWNKKALQMGGGGYNGTVVTGLDSISHVPGPTPLSKNYVTFGSDSGHVGSSATAEFALNDGALLNFGYQHLKKTHDAAFVLIKSFYGQSPQRSYFAGASTGGREGMTVVQRFPNDYDGVIANAPAVYFWGLRLIGVRIGQVEYKTTGGFVPPAKFNLVRTTALSKCDSADGAVDGIISNSAACAAKEAEIVSALRCPSGNDEGPNCLSDAQLATVRAATEDLTLPYQLSYGVTRYRGHRLFQGADMANGLGVASASTYTPPPTVAANGYLFTQGDNYMKYVVSRNTAFDTLGFDINSPGQYKQRLVDLSDIIGAMNPDTSAFQARGGKLIVSQGLADDAVSPGTNIDYYQDQVFRYGQARVDSYFRLYAVPGLGHGRGTFYPSYDQLSVLDKWVTEGVSPGTLIGTDTNTASVGRTRPICVYPSWPKYSGAGDLNKAENYSCVTS